MRSDKTNTYAVAVKAEFDVSTLPGKAVIVEKPRNSWFKSAPIEWFGRPVYAVSVPRGFDTDLLNTASTRVLQAITFEVAPLTDDELSGVYKAREDAWDKSRRAVLKLDPALSDLMYFRIREWVTRYAHEINEILDAARTSRSSSDPLELAQARDQDPPASP